MKGVITIEPIQFPFAQEFYDSLFNPNRTESEMEQIIHKVRVMDRINDIRHPATLENHIMNKSEFAKYCEEVGRNYMIYRKNKKHDNNK